MPTTPTTTTTDDRAAQALTLREQGHTFDAIAVAMGLNTRQAARSLVNTGLRRRARSSYGSLPNAAVVGMARRFGIEIECEGITQSMAAFAVERAGIACSAMGYTHAVQATWKVVSDGSLRNGCEVVSPILSGEAGLAEVATVMTALRSAGATISSRCGMHVHIDAQDLTGVQIASMIDTYVDHQRLIDPLVSPSRRSDRYATYCAAWSTSEKNTVTEWFRTGRDRTAFANVNRYRTVNVASYARYGTIEFRQHQGSLNGTKAAAWVRFLLAIATAAEAGQTVTATSTQDLLSALAPSMGGAAHQYLTNRALASGAA